MAKLDIAIGERWVTLAEDNDGIITGIAAHSEGSVPDDYPDITISHADSDHNWDLKWHQAEGEPTLYLPDGVQAQGPTQPPANQ